MSDETNAASCSSLSALLIDIASLKEIMTRIELSFVWPLVGACGSFPGNSDACKHG